MKSLKSNNFKPICVLRYSLHFCHLEIIRDKNTHSSCFHFNGADRENRMKSNRLDNDVYALFCIIFGPIVIVDAHFIELKFILHCVRSMTYICFNVLLSYPMTDLENCSYACSHYQNNRIFTSQIK